MLQDLNSSKQTTDQNTSFASATLVDLKTRESVFGVDTDAEMQHLLSVKNAYAANAKIIQTIDEMFADILRIKT